MDKFCAENIPLIDLTLQIENFDNQLANVISFCRPHWNIDNIISKESSEGVTNRLFIIFEDKEKNENEAIVVRINGDNTDSFLNRKLEMCIATILHQFGCAAKLNAQFTNGICYDYIPGQVFDYNLVSHPHYSKLVAKEMARMHSIPLDKYHDLLPNCQEGKLFDTMRHLTTLLPQCLKDGVRSAKYPADFPTAAMLLEAIDLLETNVLQQPAALALCHNDALYKNLILSSDKKRVHLIDFEFGGVNFAAFDIGNHFVEFAGMDDIDFTKYPNREFQLVWLRHYIAYKKFYSDRFRESHHLQQDLNLDEIDLNSVTSLEVERLYVQVNKFSLVSHIICSEFCAIQSDWTHVTYDFTNFSYARWCEYLRRKEEFLTLQYPLTD